MLEFKGLTELNISPICDKKGHLFDVNNQDKKEYRTCSRCTFLFYPKKQPVSVWWRYK